jgi:hypothetical protein
MTRALVLGERLLAAATALALEHVADHPDLVLVDLVAPDAIAAAAQADPMVPRLVIADPGQDGLLRALGRGGFEVLASAEPAAIGPVVARLAPPRPRSATRLVLVTGVSGGCGRTLLAVNLALRLATRGSVALIDVTGSGAAAWWLRVGAAPWSEIEGVTLELTPDHLAVVASERGAVRVVGGSGSMPSAELGAAATRAALALVDVVVVDAPQLRDERTRSIRDLADRVLVLAADDPASRAQLGAVPKDGHWVLVSRTVRDELAGHSVMRSLPDDDAAVRAAAEGDGTVGGTLGRAYDDLAELLAIDATQ